MAVILPNLYIYVGSKEQFYCLNIFVYHTDQYCSSNSDTLSFPICINMGTLGINTINLRLETLGMTTINIGKLE